MDDRVAALGCGADLVEDGLDVGLPQDGHDLAQIASGQVKRHSLVVDLLEERLQDGLARDTVEKIGDDPTSSGLITRLLGTPYTSVCAHMSANL